MKKLFDNFKLLVLAVLTLVFAFGARASGWQFETEGIPDGAGKSYSGPATITCAKYGWSIDITIEGGSYAGVAPLAFDSIESSYTFTLTATCGNYVYEETVTGLKEDEYVLFSGAGLWTLPAKSVVEVIKGGVVSTNVGLAEAFAYIGENGTGTVTMLSDLTLVESGAAWVPDGADITLDLAGKKIDWTTTKGDSLFYFAADTKGKLTIEDSGVGGTIAVYCDSSEVTNSALVAYCDGNGDLTVNSGTFVSSNKVGAATLFFKSGSGDWTFNGGSYKALGEGAGGAHFLYCGAATGTTRITGGTYEIRATAGAAAGVGSNAECFDKITLTGGDFDVVTKGAWSGAFSCGNGSMVVNGGDFGVTSSAPGVHCILAERNGTTILSNGTFRAETTAGYAYAAGATQTATLMIAGGTYFAKAFNETAATVVGKEGSQVTLVGNPVINNGATDGTAWNLAVQLFGSHLDFAGYTGTKLPALAVFADGTYGVSYVTGDMTNFDTAWIWAGYFSSYPNDGWVQDGRRVFANTNELTKAAYPWVIDGAVTFTPAVIANTTARAYTNGVALAAASSYTFQTNTANVKVVYTAETGYVFADGSAVKTNGVDTSKNPAAADAPAAPIKVITYREPVYVSGIATNGIERWVTNTCYNYTSVTSSLGPLGAPWGENGKTTWLVVAESGIEISPYAKCFGDVKLILCDGASLTVTGGIGRDPNATLTIYAELEGTGELIAVNHVGCSGIGDANITINGGRITATSEEGGAGIGGDRQCVTSNIVINAGIVTAIGGGDNSTGGGAGIGGGAYRAGCDITINGGTVSATGAISAAGIGGAAGSSGTRIVINGGMVRATGGSFGAGIGGGQSGLGSQIVISGGAVQATGGCSAAGIGGGANAVGTDITISGGVVKAVGGDTAAGIGGGCCMNGSGSRITIRSGTVTAIGGYLGAGIGGGHRCAYSKIAIGGDAKVFVGSARYRDDGLVSAAELIGNGYEVDDPAEEVTIDETAQVLFNLTGCYDKTTEAWTEEIASMPEAFDGFVLLTPAIQTENRVLVGGVGGGLIESALPAFTLTNAVTGATGEIDIDGAETTFAGTYCTLTNREGQLTFTIRKPVLTVTQLPDLTNGYTIVASTDGNNGITNYAWCIESQATTDFVALTNLVDEILVGTITGTEVASSDFDGEGELILLSWPEEDLPADGELRFSSETALADGADVIVGESGALGTLTQNGTECVWRFNSYAGDDYLCIRAKAGTSTSFTITNLRLVSSSYTAIAQGATMTALPSAVAENGSNYVCRMDYGHEGVYATAVSEAFTFSFYPAASVTTNGVTTLYASLTNAWADAIAYRGVDVLITMLSDATIESTLAHDNHGYGGMLTLDLNGYVLAYAGATDACVIKQATGPGLNIIDTDTTRRAPRYFTCDATGLWTLANEKTDLSVTGGLITGGRADAVSFTWGSGSISNVNIIGNSSASDGGAVYATVALTVCESTFCGNVSAGKGGAIYAAKPCAVSDCRIESNKAGGSGGGLYFGFCGSLVRTHVTDNRSGTGGGVYVKYSISGCFPSGVKIRMADGLEKDISEIVEGDVVATFDHIGGTNSSAAVFYVYRGSGAQNVFTLSFASGTTLDIADRHDLLAEETRKYVTVSFDNAHSYVGKRFYNYVTGNWDELVGVTAAKDCETYYSIYTRGHGNCVANGMLTIPDDKDCYLNIYELAENLKADAEQLAADIAQYGLATSADYPNVPVNDFVDGNNRYAFIAIGKGLTTQEELLFWNEYDYGPIVVQKFVRSAPKRAMSAAPMMFRGDSIPAPVEPYLQVGDGTVVTGNVTTADAASNVYLEPNLDKSPVIDILTGTENLKVGVTLSTTTGLFGWTNNVNYATCFTSDKPNLSVVYTADRVLVLRTGIQVGEDAWATVADGVCTIEGTGAMWNHTEWTSGNPLAARRLAIQSVVIADGITSVGSQFFHKFYALTNVSCAASVATVGDHAFYRCASLEAMSFAGADAPTFGTNAYTLHAGISIKDGMPDVYAVPVITISGYTQNLYGRVNLTEGDWEKITSDAQKRACRFFKIVMEK